MVWTASSQVKIAWTVRDTWLKVDIETYTDRDEAKQEATVMNETSAPVPRYTVDRRHVIGGKVV